MQVLDSAHTLAPAEQYLRAIWRGRWLFLGMVGASVGLALIVTALLPRTYSSEVMVSVRPAPQLEPAATLYGSAMVGLPSLKTQDPEDQGPRRLKRRLQANGVVTAAARDAGVIGPTDTVDMRDISKWIDVQEVEKTDLLDVFVSQPTADAARRLATALVSRAAEANRLEAGADPTTRQFLESQLQHASKAVEGAEAAVIQASGGRGVDRDVSLDRAKLDLSLAREQYTAIRKRLGLLDLIIANQQFQMTVIDPPTIPLRPSFPRPLLNVSIGLILGILAATTVIVLRSVFQGT
jgi:uncharacterized protein involved in exopolysaccharide biosynthesis